MGVIADSARLRSSVFIAPVFEMMSASCSVIGPDYRSIV